jgi:hypothetical protein
MDSNDEDIMAALMDEELAVAAATRDAAGDNEHLAILVSLLDMIAEEDKPVIGGSAPGHRKSKPRQRMEGYCMLYDDKLRPFRPMKLWIHPNLDKSKTTFMGRREYLCLCYPSLKLLKVYEREWTIINPDFSSNAMSINGIIGLLNGV